MKKETIIKFYSNYKLYIFPISVALSSVFLILFVIYPQAMKLIINQKNISDLIVKAKFLENKVSALESYDEKDLSQKVNLVLAVVPTEKDFGNTLGLLQEISAKSGFSIVSIVLSNAVNKAGNAESYEVKLEVTGTKTLFQTLLNNLENASRLIKVNSIDISSNQASQTVNVSLSIRVFYSQLPPNFGTEDSPLPQINQKDEELLATLARASEAGPSSSIVQPSTPSSPRGKLNPFE